MKRMANILIAAALMLGLSAFAHHSTSAYDVSRTITLQGMVKEFQWTNPHSWVQVVVPQDAGADVVWSIETGAPNLNARNGWKRDDLKPGDKVTVVVYPIRDGSAHGTLATVTLADGRVLKGAADFIREQFAPPGAGGSAPSGDAAK